ncbi:hypothetical protein B0H34DRAFT_798958 [Crassisporium funariophilum]|nr:hypothetical protein B0H34DRAFT_798958 [Crassisporium funariophilum]
MSTKPQVPVMVLSAASNPLTEALRKKNGLSPAERATERFSIKGNAIVTGGAGGLGLEACRALLEHGLSGLCIFDLASALGQSAAALQTLRWDFPLRKILQSVVDVTDEKNVHEGVQVAVAALGSVDILLCFAGIARASHSAEMPLADWQKVIDINATGSWLCAQAVGKQMIRKGTGGSIIFTASICGHRSLFPIPHVAYDFTKAGLLQLTRSLAAEWAVHGIRVNSLSPGYMDTPMIALEGRGSVGRQMWEERNPMGRVGDPTELTGAVVLFCSPAGRYITGVDLLVDGGAHIF